MVQLMVELTLSKIKCQLQVKKFGMIKVLVTMLVLQM